MYSGKMRKTETDRQTEKAKRYTKNVYLGNYDKTGEIWTEIDIKKDKEWIKYRKGRTNKFERKKRRKIEI